MEALSEARVDARDAPGDRREDVGDTLVVEGDAAARENGVIYVLFIERRNDDVRLGDLLLGEPRLPGGGLRRRRSRGGFRAMRGCSTTARLVGTLMLRRC